MKDYREPSLVTVLEVKALTPRQERQRAYKKAWYLRNRERLSEEAKAKYLAGRKSYHQAYWRLPENKARDRKWRLKKAVNTRAYLQGFKAERGCIRCKEKDPIVLQFHHRDPSRKKFNLGEQAHNKSWETLQAEIAKCDIICANCHLRLHWEEKRK